MIHEFDQGADDWLRYKAGRVSASMIADLTAKTKSGWGASRNNLMARLIAERLTGEPSETYCNDVMRRGIEVEPEARAAYAFLLGVEVLEVGFVDHPDIERAGCSPDGFVGESGLVEIKAPKTSTHIDTLLGAGIDRRYRLQMMWQMACTGRAWCDFVSYDPRLPGRLSIHIRRVERDDNLIADLEKDVREFIAEMEDKIHRLQNETGGEA